MGLLERSLAGRERLRRGPRGLLKRCLVGGFVLRVRAGRLLLENHELTPVLANRPCERGLAAGALGRHGLLERLSGVLLAGALRRGVRARSGDRGRPRRGQLAGARRQLRRVLPRALIQLPDPLLRGRLLGAGGVDEGLLILPAALQLEDAIDMIGLLPVQRQELVAQIEDLLVLARHLVAQGEDLLVLLVERLAQIEEFATRHRPRFRGRRRHGDSGRALQLVELAAQPGGLRGSFAGERELRLHPTHA